MIMIVVVRITVMMLRLTISDGNEHKSVNNDADDNSENDDLDRACNVTVLVFCQCSDECQTIISSYEVPELSTLPKPFFLKATTQKLQITWPTVWSSRKPSSAKTASKWLETCTRWQRFRFMEDAPKTP